ncbi:CENPBD1 [Cordylochernes scorpioides]|uniref:CENPBD1 n=1 Tax=Cordylochernes scorpioides TaxID=51811 RepID=A0ABY6L8D3_9ARAC|nr:CENPBD1 [Cordylochernes scorpioides]
MKEKGAVGRIAKNTKKKTISLETKLDILRRFDKGEKAVEIAKAVGLAATTVRTIRDPYGDKIREAAKFATSLDAEMMTRTRSASMIKMESLLSIWIENQVAERIPLSKMVIQKKARSLFDDIKGKVVSDDNANGSENETFESSQGWFERFKVRANLHSITLKGEAASADITAAERYPTEFKKNYSRGVLWFETKRSYLKQRTTSLFKNWVTTCAVPEIKAHCIKENLNFKALVIEDNAPSHPVYVDELSENVKFVFFFQPNTTPIIQPMDQGVISTFKGYYLRRTFKLLLSETDGQDKPTMLEFWKMFSIMKAIKIISDSWEEVKPSCMNGVWRKIWPECVHRSAAEVDGTPAVRHEISNLARESNFEGIEETDINELLTSHNQEFSNKELLQLELHFANEEDDSNRLIEISKEQNLTSKQISKAMCLIDEAMEIFLKNDPDSGRSLKVSQAVATNINCYKEIYLKLKKKLFNKQ